MNQNITLAENTLGQRIKAQRIKMGLTQEKLAELMCVPKPTISSYLTNFFAYKAVSSTSLLLNPIDITLPSLQRRA